MKMTLKERIARSQELLSDSDFHDCMLSNDMDVVFYASSMVGSQLNRYDNKILMNRNAVPKRWDSDPSRSGCHINFAFKIAYTQVVEYIDQSYNITPGRLLKLQNILSCGQSEYSRVRKYLTNSNKILCRYLQNLNDLRMHTKEMTDSEIYDFSFDMMYYFIDMLSLSNETLSISFLIMYWIQRESYLVPLALACKKNAFYNTLVTLYENTRDERASKKEFRLFMRKVLDLHLKVFIQNESKDGKKSPSRDRILNLIKGNPNHTAKTMASCLGLSVQAIQKQIAILKSENRLIRIGPDKGGHWKVLEESLLSSAINEPY